MTTNRAIRVGVVACSVILVGAYVGYRVVRAKEGDAPTAPTPAAVPEAPTRDEHRMQEFMMRSSKGSIDLRLEDPPVAPPKGKDPTMFYGSKSAPVVEPKDVRGAPQGGE
jgi:hypothetical protein